MKIVNEEEKYLFDHKYLSISFIDTLTKMCRYTKLVCSTYRDYYNISPNKLK